MIICTYVTLFRFVNIFTNSKLDKKIVWNHIHTLRFEYLKNGVYGVIGIECQNNFLSKRSISLNIKRLSKFVGGVNDANEINGKLSKSDLNDSAEMFVALNSCPSVHEKLYWKAIYRTNARTIALIASKIIRKSNTDFKRDAKKIFGNIISILGFEHIGYHHDESNNFNGDLSWFKNILDIKGKKQDFEKLRQFDI